MAIFTIKNTDNKKILCTQSPKNFAPLNEIECATKEDVANAFIRAREANQNGIMFQLKRELSYLKDWQR